MERDCTECLRTRLRVFTFVRGFPLSPLTTAESHVRIRSGALPTVSPVAACLLCVSRHGRSESEEGLQCSYSRLSPEMALTGRLVERSRAPWRRGRFPAQERLMRSVFLPGSLTAESLLGLAMISLHVRLKKIEAG